MNTMVKTNKAVGNREALEMGTRTVKSLTPTVKSLTPALEDSLLHTLSNPAEVARFISFF